MSNTNNTRIDFQFDSNGTIYTARAGLVPVVKMIRETGIDERLDEACQDMWGEARSARFGFESAGLLLLGVLAGLPRAYQIVNSSEANFFAQLLHIDHVPSQPALSRFITSFGEKNIESMKRLVADVAEGLPSDRSGGFRIIAHDQTAIQKFGNLMEGVEKGYGGTIRQGAKMLQASLVIDACASTILDGELRAGSTHSAAGAVEQLGRVLAGAKPSKEPTLVLADCAYGFGDYIRLCEKHDASFILAIKHDAWLQKAIAESRIKNFSHGSTDEGYAYADFIAARKVWAPEDPSPNPRLDGLRVVLVRLPGENSEAPRYQYLLTNLLLDWSNEEVHQLYKQHREAIEIMNDELKNQLGLTELPSQSFDGNRGMAQIQFLAWNIQRAIERVGLKKQRDKENRLRQEREKADAISEKKLALRAKVQNLKGKLQRFEWWSVFVRYISVGGKFSLASRKRTVFVADNPGFREWATTLMNFDWHEVLAVT